MRTAAHRQAGHGPAPASGDLGERADRLLAAHSALIERGHDLLAAWTTACPQDSQAVPALRDLSVLIADAGRHAEELRQDMAAYTGTAEALGAAFAAGRAFERDQLAREEAPAPEGGRHRGKRLRLVGGSGIAAIAGAAFGRLGLIFRHGTVSHPVAMALRNSWAAQHLAASGTLAATALTATAVLAPGSPVSPLHGGAAGTGPAPAAGVYASATPFPAASSSQAASVVIRTLRGRSGAGSSRTLSIPLPASLPVAAVPVYAPSASPSAPDGGTAALPSAAAPAQGQVGVSTTALDLSGSGTGTFTITASGGAVSWHVISGKDVSADVRQGELQDGESATVTLTIDPAALVLGGSATVRIWPGNETVSVTWSAPVVPSAVPPVPDVVPSGVVPSVLPSS